MFHISWVYRRKTEDWSLEPRLSLQLEGPIENVSHLLS